MFVAGITPCDCSFRYVTLFVCNDSCSIPSRYDTPISFLSKYSISFASFEYKYPLYISPTNVVSTVAIFPIGVIDIDCASSFVRFSPFEYKEVCDYN